MLAGLYIALIFLQSEIRYDPELIDVLRNYTPVPSVGLSPLTLSPDDIRWEIGPGGNYIDLIVRKKPEINSIMLTNPYKGEYAKIYGAKAYGLRAVPNTPGFNSYLAVNGNEVRITRFGRFVGRQQGLYFLVTSTVINHPVMGLAFRLRIPKYVEFGYIRPGENHGYILVTKGTVLNVRTFKAKYADYRYPFADNFVTVEISPPPSLIRPKITLLSRRDEGEYVILHVRYQSKSSRYFRKFIIREKKGSGKLTPYEDIGFVFGPMKEHKKAKLLSSSYIQGIGKIVNALIYLRKDNKSHTYYIAAIDDKGNQTENEIKVLIPPYGYSYNPAQLPTATSTADEFDLLFNE